MVTLPAVYVIKNRLFGRLLALFDVDVFGTRKCFNFDVIRVECQNVPEKQTFVAAVVFAKPRLIPTEFVRFRLKRSLANMMTWN